MTALFCLPAPAMAVRPFVTDDARVVGANLFLLETSLRMDKTRLQNTNLLAYGPTEKLELTLGFVDGVFLEGEDSWKMSIAGPLAQAKYLFTEGTPNGYPGLAVVAGTGSPYGTYDFGNPSWSGFAYLAATESLGENERVLIHFNIGTNYSQAEGESWKFTTTWGVGMQIRLVGGLYSVSEIFYGDPYVGDVGGAFQVGFRYFVSERIQLDATVGSGLWGNTQLDTWGGIGFRIVFDSPWK
jgi:hypothetical protein